MVAELGVDGSY